jgi:hypothetical protein
VQQADASRLGISAIQKVLAAIRILAYGLPADVVDEYVRIGESITQRVLDHFCRAIIACFGEQYLDASNAADITRLLEINTARGFLESIDCTH